MAVQTKKKLLPLLGDAIRDIDAEAQDAESGEPAAVDMSAAAHDVAGDAAGEGAGGSAGGARKSVRILNWAKQGASGPTFADNLCEMRKYSFPVCVPGARVPEQGCFCAKGCAGHAGMCTNQVPIVNTHDNVKVAAANSNYGQFLTAARDIEAGEMITIFAGVIVKKFTHADAYDTFQNIHTLQQQKEKGEKRFEYSARTGSTAIEGSQAWVIPPEDVPLLRECITLYDLQETELNRLVSRHKTWQKGLGQFTQHTCCPKHVNAYFFPISVMRSAPQPRGCKRAQDEEIMDLQALALRAQKAIEQGDEILVHYVGAGKTGDFVFDCRCCKCFGPCRREVV